VALGIEMNMQTSKENYGWRIWYGNELIQIL